MVEHAYIHIPFCLRKCNYCSFVSGLSLKNKDSYLDALFYEIKERYKGENLKTLYIGGGTPSLLETEDIQKIIDCFSFQKNCEITLEVNPETVFKSKFQKIKQLGINRISLGVQTFDNNILKIIGRNHSQNEIVNSLQIIKNCGFDNISIDLIYGLPNQSFEIFRDDIEKTLLLDVPHISTYGLKIEENSYFGKNPPDNLPNDELQAEMFNCLSKTLKDNKFIHYEISNFAKEGFESKHNCAYWLNKNYYGFGLNASGYERNIRYKNTCNLKKYLNNSMEKDEEISLNIQEIMEDEIFLGLRLRQGINISEINNKFNIDFEKKYSSTIKKYIDLHLMKIQNGFCKLTENGFLLSNEIMCEFID